MGTRAGVGETGEWDAQARRQLTSDRWVTRTVWILRAVGKGEQEAVQGPRWNVGIIRRLCPCLKEQQSLTPHVASGEFGHALLERQIYRQSIDL